jgi:hypothetical protein
MRRQAREWWAKLRNYFDGNVGFFSEDERTDREKAPVREFVRYLGIGFTEEELVVPPKDDDVDVRFREARFQNVERMEGAHRRHEEVRGLAERARTVCDVRALLGARSAEVGLRVTMGCAERPRRGWPCPAGDRRQRDGGVQPGRAVALPTGAPMSPLTTSRRRGRDSHARQGEAGKEHRHAASCPWACGCHPPPRFRGAVVGRRGIRRSSRRLHIHSPASGGRCRVVAPRARAAARLICTTQATTCSKTQRM